MTLLELVNVTPLNEHLLIYEQSLEEYIESSSGRREYKKDLIFSGECRDIPYALWDKVVLRISNSKGRIRIDI